MVVDFEKFKDENIILVYHEGNTIKSCEGKLTSFNDEFLEVIQNSKNILFNKKFVVSVSKG